MRDSGSTVHGAGLLARGWRHPSTLPCDLPHPIVVSQPFSHGEEREAYGDAGYRGVEKRPEQARAEVAWRVAMRPGLRRLLEPRSAEARAERAKASLRAKVEHPFLAVKRRFGYDKVRYRGLAKNRERLALLLGLTNLLRAEPQLA